jgi:hypothetical protein
MAESQDLNVLSSTCPKYRWLHRSRAASHDLVDRKSHPIHRSHPHRIHVVVGLLRPFHAPGAPQQVFLHWGSGHHGKRVRPLGASAVSNALITLLNDTRPGFSHAAAPWL